MVMDMTYKPDGSGNLYRRGDGTWAIKFKAEDFKNHEGAAKEKDYDVPLPVGLNDEIEHYLKAVRPLFSDASDRAFVTKKTKRKSRAKFEGADEIESGTDWLGPVFEHRTKTFIPGSPGFRPHAMRHIVATDYIKNHPGDYLTAAQILHDTIETVMAEYAHLAAADGLKRSHDYQEELKTRWGKGA